MWYSTNPSVYTCVGLYTTIERNTDDNLWNNDRSILAGTIIESVIGWACALLMIFVMIGLCCLCMFVFNKGVSMYYYEGD